MSGLVVKTKQNKTKKTHKKHKNEKQSGLLGALIKSYREEWFFCSKPFPGIQNGNGIS